jgi:hypothetical protein
MLFDLLADQPETTGPNVLRGHDNGVITIAPVEADEVEREKRRKGMGKPYRTLIGHFRYEVSRQPALSGHARALIVAQDKQLP